MSSRKPKKGIFFGLLTLPQHVETQNFCVVGSPGTGKTCTLRMLMKSVLPNIEEGRDLRAFVYDGKSELYPILKGLNSKCPVHLLNPFDRRAVAWNMAKDIKTYDQAGELAAILIPEPEGTSTGDPVWNDTARDIIKNVLISFMENSPEQWTMRDIVYATKSPDRLRQVLENSEESKDALSYFASEGQSASHMMTIKSKISKYESIAAAWHHCKEKVSLEDWVKSPSMLVLGMSPRSRESIKALNQLIFHRLTQILLSQKKTEDRRTWLFLDELKEAGKLPNLGYLLNQIRAFGGCVVIAFQSIPGLRSVFKDDTAEVTGNCANKMFLGTDEPETAEWASKHFQKMEVEITKLSVSHSDNGESTSTSVESTEKEVLMPSQFLQIPGMSKIDGFTSYNIIPALGETSRYGVTMEFKEFIDLLPKKSKDEEFEPRDESEFRLPPWGEEDWKQLKLKPPEISKQKEEEKEGGNFGEKMRF